MRFRSRVVSRGRSHFARTSKYTSPYWFDQGFPNADLVHPDPTLFRLGALRVEMDSPVRSFPRHYFSRHFTLFCPVLLLHPLASL